jgi:predicted HTH transcriptional regulator
LEEKKILIYLLDNGKITRKKATKILNVQNTKAYETLNLLVEKNLIQRQGKGRSTYYVLKNNKP